MTITEKLDEIHKEIDELGYNPSVYGIDDDEDMILFALRYLLSNLDDAFAETVNEVLALREEKRRTMTEEEWSEYKQAISH